MQIHDEQQTTLDWLLASRSIQTWFQPIVSVKKQAVIGLEALARGLNASNGLIMPANLFTMAADQGKSVELDRLCREKALHAYQYRTSHAQDCFLFLNLNTSILDEGVVGSGHLINTVRQLNLKPTSIVIEIIESKVHDIRELIAFIRRYKQYGFLIALDDMGSDSSNLDRILQVHPDIIKIDRGLIKGIHKDYYKQELYKALVMIAKKTGALVIAEGVETYSEAVTSLELGADFLQGYYLAQPAPLIPNSPAVSAKTLQHLRSAFQISMVEGIRQAVRKKQFYETVLATLTGQLTGVSPAKFGNLLSRLATEQTGVQCCYILDLQGRQITETFHAAYQPTDNQHGMFHPDGLGADQSLKDYYLYIHAGFESYISEPYISLANGQPCLTGSILFQASTASSYILCIDFAC